MTRRAWVLFVAMCGVWGLPYLLIKVAVAEADPTFVVFVRLAVAAIILLPIAIVTGSLRRLKRHWIRLGLVASVGIVVPFLLIAYGEQHVTSSLAALLIAADPLFVVLLALPFDASERPDAPRLVGLFVGLLGVAVVLGLDLGGDAFGVLGGLMVLLASVCYAFSALLVKGLDDVPKLGSVTVTLTLAAVVLAAPAAFNVPTRLPGVPVIASLLTLAILCTAVAYIMYFTLITEAGATRASLITYVNPAVAVLLGVLVLSEPLSMATLLGFCLIVLGCALATGLLGVPRFWRHPGRRIARGGAEFVEDRSS